MKKYNVIYILNTVALIKLIFKKILEQFQLLSLILIHL